MRIIPSNTATATLRRIPFTLVDATDLVTPEDITVSGEKVSLDIDGGTPANSTNDIVKVTGATGDYYLELTQSEANQTAGAMIRGTLTPSGCAMTKIQAQIGTADIFAAAITAADIADAVLDEATSGHTTAGTLGKAVIDILEDTATTIPATLTTIDTEVGVIDGIVDTLLTRVTAAVATATDLATVDNEIAAIQSDVTAVKAKTDSLTFTVAGSVDANAKRMNDAAVLGNGTSGNLWRGA